MVSRQTENAAFLTCIKTRAALRQSYMEKPFMSGALS
jgi:hypothetical protein